MSTTSAPDAPAPPPELHAEDVRVRGYSDGLYRRPPRSTDPIYLAAYAIGARRAPPPQETDNEEQ